MSDVVRNELSFRGVKNWFIMILVILVIINVFEVPFY